MDFLELVKFDSGIKLRSLGLWGKCFHLAVSMDEVILCQLVCFVTYTRAEVVNAGSSAQVKGKNDGLPKYSVRGA